MTLCDLKVRTELTPHQLETWTKTLSVFPIQIVNRSILEIGLSEDPFPDLGKIVMRCQRMTEAHKYSPHGATNESTTPNMTTIQAVAESLALDIAYSKPKDVFAS